MTYRERREARAERLREWAEKRQRAAVEQLNSQPEMRHDWAFITQPGRIPERDRMNRADERAFRSMEKAESMSARADGIEAQLDRAIYTDDADAPERLREKIAALEAERARWTAYNKAARKLPPIPNPRAIEAHIPADVLAILSPKQQRDLVGLARVVPYQIGKHGEAPAYIGANIGGNLGRLRKRLEWIERGAEKYLTTRRADTCARCGADVPIGTTVAYSKLSGTVRHLRACPE